MDNITARNRKGVERCPYRVFIAGIFLSYWTNWTTVTCVRMGMNIFIREKCTKEVQRNKWSRVRKTRNRDRTEKNMTDYLGNYIRRENELETKHGK
jgi:hypothetical protein